MCQLISTDVRYTKVKKYRSDRFSSFEMHFGVIIKHGYSSKTDSEDPQNILMNLNEANAFHFCDDMPRELLNKDSYEPGG